MDLAGVATLIGAVTGMVAALGALYVSVNNSRKADSARDKAVEAATKAGMAAEEAAASKAEIVKVGSQLFTLGANVDGRLSKLLATTEALAHAQGVAEGRATERADVAQRAMGERMPRQG